MIGNGCSLEQIQEQPARHSEYVDACTTQTTERMAQTIHSARKRKECPTKVEQRNTRSRYAESTHTTLEVQASWETCSHSTLVTSTPRPVIGSEWIQHQGQPRDRTLMAHGKGSTKNSSDVLDAGEDGSLPAEGTGHSITHEYVTGNQGL